MPDQTHVNVGGSWEQARTVYVKVSGAWRSVSEIWTRVSGVWEQVFESLSASNNGPASALDATVTNSVTVTPSNGASPYAYSWARISGDPTPAISNATAQTVTWSVPSPFTYVATWRCTVTDAHGSTAATDVSVTFDVT